MRRVSMGRRFSTSSSSSILSAFQNKQEVDEGLERMRIAQEKFLTYSQSQVDHIFENVSFAMKTRALELAKEAVEESGIGLVEDKVLKNIYATEHSLAMYKNTRTVGVIDSDPFTGITKIAEPVGPICAILPCTNPTSTTIMKSLYSIKTRNCVFFLPHPRSKLCSIHAASMVQHYAKLAGAPDDIIMSAMPSRELSDYVMKHPETKFLLATGGSDMVKACYSVGKPAIGVGPGNTPVLMDGSFDLRQAVNSVMIGKTFDWGVPCITEQSTIIVDPFYEEAKDLFQKRGVYFLDSEEEKKRLADFFMPNGERVNADIVGKSPQAIAQACGISIPPDALAIGVEVSAVGDEEIFSHEKLSPLLSLYRAKTFEEGLETARQLAEYGGPGHSSCLFTTNNEHLRRFQEVMPTYHVNVNMPALGGIGIRYNPNIQPSMTVGCGSKGGSMASVNVGPKELIHIKHVVNNVENQNTPYHPPPVYRGLDKSLRNVFQKFGGGDILVVSDPSVIIRDLPYDISRYGGKRVHTIHTEHNRSMTWNSVQSHVKKLDFQPNIIFAIGDCYAMDAAKMIRLYMENPQTPVHHLTSPFIESHWRKRLVPLTCKVPLIAVPTLASIGAEMTPFSQHVAFGCERVPVCSEILLPDAVIYDDEVGLQVSKDKMNLSGFTALLMCIESVVSADSTASSKEEAIEAIGELFGHLGKKEDGLYLIEACRKAGEAVSVSGMGTAMAMAMSFSDRFNLPMGVAMGVFIPHVIRYNSTDKPVRINATPNYPYPQSRERYSQIVEHVMPRIEGMDPIDELVFALRGLARSLKLPCSVGEMGLVTEQEYKNMVEDLALGAFGNQLSSNPRLSLLTELQDLFLQSYHE